MIVPYLWIALFGALAPIQEPPGGGGHLGTLAAEGARDATGEGLAFVEIAALPAKCYVHQPVRIQWSIGIQEEFLRTRIVQPFGVRLDLPVQLSAPWLEDPGDLHPRVGEAQPASLTLAVNESVRTASRAEDRVVQGQRFRVCEFEAVVLPGSARAVSLAPPRLGFAYATRFADTLLAKREPLDRVDAFVTGKALVLEVLPLPEAGRPPEFTGAVGSFSVRADVRPLQVVLGEGVKLDLTITGEGNLELFEPPRWKDLGGFRVLGLLDEGQPGARKLTYDLEPRSEKVWQVPSISFAYFDPAPPGRYRTATTAAIDVEVRLPEEPRAAPQEPAPARCGPWGWTAGGVLAVLAVLAVAYRRRG